MLHEFLAEHRVELARRCRAKVGVRGVPQPAAIDLEFGIPLFLEQLITTLRTDRAADRPPGTRAKAIGDTAGKHGNELLRHGFTVDQVVRGYGDLCQSVTELAGELGAPVTVDEFRTFNACLDDAIADAVTEFGRQRDQVIAAKDMQTTNERLGSLAHELRNLLNTATLAFEAIKSGCVAVNGATGAVLDRTLSGLRDLIDRSLAEVRLSEGLEVHGEPILLHAFLQELQISAALDAKVRGNTFTVEPVDVAIMVTADRHTLASALSNLVQNALKFSHPLGHVRIVVTATVERVLIEVHDECGGLPKGKLDEMFRPFTQHAADRTGVGLGLPISRRAVEANGGHLTARDIPGTGCVFTIDLPRLLPDHS